LGKKARAPGPICAACKAHKKRRRSQAHGERADALARGGRDMLAASTLAQRMCQLLEGLQIVPRDGEARVKTLADLQSMQTGEGTPLDPRAQLSSCASTAEADGEHCWKRGSACTAGHCAVSAPDCQNDNLMSVWSQAYMRSRRRARKGSASLRPA